jgi:glutamate synthase (NADPH/NADH) small chain
MFLMGDDGRVGGVRCQRVVLGAPDESGRQTPIPVRGSNFVLDADTSNFVLDADTVVVAVGYRVDPDFSQRTGLAVDRSGRVLVDSVTGATNLPGVYAAGDAVNGADLVVTAIASGRRAARGIHAALSRVAAEPSRAPAPL